MPYIPGQNIGGVTGQLLASLRQKKAPGAVEASAAGPSTQVRREVVAQAPLQDGVQGQNLAQNVLPQPPQESTNVANVPDLEKQSKINVLNDLIKTFKPRIRNRDKVRVKTILDQGR